MNTGMGRRCLAEAVGTFGIVIAPVALSEERTVRIEGIDAGEVLVFDLA